MALWFALSLMTIGAVFAVLWPLARKPERVEGANDLAVYRDQLEEVRRDRATQSIGEKEAAAAEVEISRRLIAAADTMHISTIAPSGAMTWRRRIVAATVLALLPIGAAGTYLALGSPSLPDQPLGSRVTASRGTQSIDSLIAQVEEHLRKTPDDGRGWELIAPVYMRLGRFKDAVAARRNALRLNGANAEREAALGEALVFAANGVVTEEAKTAFDRALGSDAAQVQARYSSGLRPSKMVTNSKLLKCGRACSPTHLRMRRGHISCANRSNASSPAQALRAVRPTSRSEPLPSLIPISAAA